MAACAMAAAYSTAASTWAGQLRGSGMCGALRFTGLSLAVRSERGLPIARVRRLSTASVRHCGRHAGAAVKAASNINRSGLVVRPKQPFFDWAMCIVDGLPDRAAHDMTKARVRAVDTPGAC